MHGAPGAAWFVNENGINRKQSKPTPCTATGRPRQGGLPAGALLLAVALCVGGEPNDL